jgi:hypothetical protein
MRTMMAVCTRTHPHSASPKCLLLQVLPLLPEQHHLPGVTVTEIQIVTGTIEVAVARISINLVLAYPYPKDSSIGSAFLAFFYLHYPSGLSGISRIILPWKLAQSLTQTIVRRELSSLYQTLLSCQDALMEHFGDPDWSPSIPGWIHILCCTRPF